MTGVCLVIGVFMCVCSDRCVHVCVVIGVFMCVLSDRCVHVCV